MALELRNIEKRVGAEVHIHPTSLTLADSGFNILLGTTLAGKTTLMQLMAGIDKPTKGEIWFRGRNVTNVAVQKRNVSMVYQQFINYPNMSVYDNIASPLRVARVASAQIDRRVGEVAEMMKLTPMLKRRPNELSGGQQQRTAMARALIKDADLVLFDEPLANLDYKLREELRDELPKLFAERDCTVVYATTEPTEALLLGGHTALLHKGRICQFGPTSEIYRNPRDLISAQVFSDPPINLARVDKKGNRITLSDNVAWDAAGKLRAAPDGVYTMGIRPHHISPAASGEQSVPLEGEVLVTEISGSESVVHFRLAGQSWVSQSHGIHAYEVGQKTRLYANIGKAMLFDADNNLVAG